MQVKIFKERSHIDMEARVNLWLKTYGDRIEIIKILQTQVETMIIITILYKPL